VNDFVTELEAELLDAARRRAARPRRRWSPARPRLAPLATAAAIGLIAAVVVLAVRGLDGSPPADDAPVPPGGGAPVTLATAAPAVACAEGEPKAVEDVRDLGLSVFARQPTVPETVPSLSWVPAETVYPKGVREIGPGHFATKVRLIPVSGLRESCEAPRGDGDGVCLIAGTRDATFRCFSTAAIDRGAAIVLTGEGIAHGIVPDGVARVRVEWDGGAASAETMDNGYELRAPGLREGEQVRVHFERESTLARCAPSSEAMAAVPLLRAESPGEPPTGVVKAMEYEGARGAWRAYARMTEGPEGLQIWVAPDMPCDNPRSQAERVCLVIEGEDSNRGFICARPRDIAERGVWFPFPDEEGRTGVAGMAPTGTADAATVYLGDDATMIEGTSGVFCAILPSEFGPGGDRIEVRFVDGPDLTVLNGTAIEGLAGEIGERLPGPERIGDLGSRDVAHTTVYYGHEDARPLAEHVAGVLRVDRVEPMPEDVAERSGDGGLAVVVGSDQTELRPEHIGAVEATGGGPNEAADTLRDRLALGPPHLLPTGERNERSIVLYTPGWERLAREAADRLGIETVEMSTTGTTPDEQLGTPIVVVIGRDLVAG
jgi:LytR cell envelope-related transcriptional attenuator